MPAVGEESGPVGARQEILQRSAESTISRVSAIQTNTGSSAPAHGPSRRIVLLDGLMVACVPGATLRPAMKYRAELSGVELHARVVRTLPAANNFGSQLLALREFISAPTVADTRVK